MIEPLRQLRRSLKGQSDPDIQALRRRVGTLELAAERRAQSRLAATIALPAAGGDREAASQVNIALYLGVEAQSPEVEILRRAIVDFTAR